MGIIIVGCSMVDGGGEVKVLTQNEVKEKVLAIIERTLGQSTYDSTKIATWATAIANQSLRIGVDNKDTSRYSVSVYFVQANKGGFHAFSTCYWDEQNDMNISIPWKNRYMHCIVQWQAIHS